MQNNGSRENAIKSNELVRNSFNIDEKSIKSAMKFASDKTNCTNNDNFSHKSSGVTFKTTADIKPCEISANGEYCKTIVSIVRQ